MVPLRSSGSGFYAGIRNTNRSVETMGARACCRGDASVGRSAKGHGRLLSCADGAAIYSSTGVNQSRHGLLVYWLQEAITPLQVISINEAGYWQAAVYFLNLIHPLFFGVHESIIYLM